jgi:hypothetical protein
MTRLTDLVMPKLGTIGTRLMWAPRDVDGWLPSQRPMLGCSV